MATEELPRVPLADKQLQDYVKEEIQSKLKERNLEYRTKVVEKAIEPLIDKVTGMSEVPGDGCGGESKRQPQKLSKLIQLVDMATRNFLAAGEEIAYQNPDFQEEVLFACDDVRSHGELLQAAAVQFSQGTAEPDNRTRMTKACKNILLSVARLMVVADMVDINNLLQATRRVEARLRSLQNATTESEIVEKMKDFSEDISLITQRAALQPNDGRSEQSQQLVATAQMELNQARRMLACTSKAFIQFAGAKAAKENQEYVIVRLLDSLKTLSLLATGDDSSITDVIPASPGELATTLSRLQDNLAALVSLQQSSSTEQLQSCTLALQQDFDMVLQASSELAASQTTRSNRQQSLLACCGEVARLSNQLYTFISRGDNVRDLVAILGGKATEMKKELCLVAIEQVCDVFVGTLGPLVSLCEAAQEGHFKLVQHRTRIFHNHSYNMIKAALLSVSLSNDAKNNRLVKIAVKNVQTLLPQVANAAYTQSRSPESLVALKSLSVFKETWAENVSALTSSVDSITPLPQFMAVTEALTIEDGQLVLASVEACNTREVADVVELIRSRCKRLVHTVKTELKTSKESYTKGQAQQSSAAMENLITKALSRLSEVASQTSETLYTTRDVYRVNFKALEESLQKVVENIRNVRRSILVSKAAGELEDQRELEDLEIPPRPMTPTPSILSQISNGSTPSLMMSGHVSSRPRFQRTPRQSVEGNEDAMSQLAPEHQQQLALASDELTAQHTVFEAEVNKWDESGNDIVMLAKEMSTMMVDMTDYTRGEGPLHSTMDVIVISKDIVRAAVILDRLARSIAEHCPDPHCQRDIFAYLDKMRLYCHQLTITASVKADIKSSPDEAVENASTLITTSKNLMTAVVDTVKTCYIATTAISHTHGGSVSDQFGEWRLTLPHKKKLHRSDSEVAEQLAMSEGGQVLVELGKFKPGRGRDPLMSTLRETPYES